MHPSTTPSEVASPLRARTTAPRPSSQQFAGPADASVGRATPRAKDIWEWLAAFALTLALSPLLLVVALIVSATTPGPVLHRRRVLGRGGVQFDAYKYRTMVADADDRLRDDHRLRQAFEINYKLARDPRVTAVGGWLRRFSVDELPQLLNVLKGEMALVGPRMISPPELERYGVHATRLLSVKPGLTGLWQVSGRQQTSYDERVALDMRYLDEQSLWLDLKILTRTLPTVFRARGAY